MNELLLTLTEAAATAAEAGAGEQPQTTTAGALVGSLLPLILMVAVFYFLLIRPQRKKDKKTKEMLNSLKPGDRVCTIGGIYGTIVAIKDDTVTLTAGFDDSKIVFARWAIRSVENGTVENDKEVEVLN